MSELKKALFTSRRLPYSRCLITTALVLLLAPKALSEDASNSGQEAKDTDQEISKFTLPQTLSEGRDPFYPNSTRVMAMMHPQKPNTSGPAKLELKGISGTPDRPLAIINNRTLAVGEEQEVTTPQGRVRVMCLAIEGMRVRIRAQGQTRELMLRKGI